MKKQLSEFYKSGNNRRRQVAHGTEIPKKRFPQVVIVGAKKCGTSALKIFMNYHPKLRDTPGEKHFFNRPANWRMGFDWYLDQMPYSYADEVTYEKTPDYFDRPFVPERMAQMNDSVKVISIMCDPVHRAYSHFLHAGVVQASWLSQVWRAPALVSLESIECCCDLALETWVSHIAHLIERDP